MTWVLLCAAIVPLSGWEDRPALIRFGGDPANGILVNYTAGTRPFDPPDPSRPTVVFIHGINPAPQTVHFEITRHLALALARRGGPAINVLGWNWNAASCPNIFRSSVNQDAAVQQGGALAEALRQAGIAPASTHLIGHSSGCIVATAAARAIVARSGRRAAQLTLLDPATWYHDLVFQRLAAGSAADRVENDWTPAPSGYGRAVHEAGVWNLRVAGPTPYLGVVSPRHSDHLNLVHWYLGTAADASIPSGFNTSLLLRGGGDGPVETDRLAGRRKMER